MQIGNILASYPPVFQLTTVRPVIAYVTQGDKKQTVSWVGDSKTPRELGTAIKELTSLVHKIEKSRRE
jgi:hypothetical protein